jgi:hypothetical protein
MSEYFSTNIKIPFRELNKECKEADVSVHSLNYGRGGSSDAEIGASSYYDCNHFRNAWYSKMNRSVSGYHNSSSFQGEYEDKSLKELKHIAFLRGREIAKKIISQWSLEDETLIIVRPPNSLSEGNDRDKIVKNASNHIGSWIGCGVIAFLELEGHEVVPIRYEEFTSIRQKHIHKIDTPFRLILVDDTILKGRTVYPWIRLALEFLITINSEKFPIDNYRIDVCTFFTRFDGIKFLENKNGWSRYGLTTQSISENPIVNPRVTGEMYARILSNLVDSEDRTPNEERLIQQQGY